MADPIELTPFEWSMANASGRSALTFFIRLGFTGELDSGALRFAIDRAVRLHPLLSSHVRFTRRPRWQPLPDSRPYVSIAESEQSLEFPGSESIDLESEIGVRVWVRHHDGQVEMHFQFHHACCDGLGAFRVIEDVLRLYGEAVSGGSGDALVPPSTDVAISLRTTCPSNKLGIGRRILRKTIVLPRRITKLFFQSPDPFMSRPQVGGVPQEATALLRIPSHVFDKAFTQSLVQAAKSVGATLNDLLIRDLFLTIYDWNERLRAGTSKEIRLLIPFSLRTKQQPSMPAANCVSMVYMSADRRALKQPMRLLTSVTAQRKFIRKWQIEHSWNQTAALIALSPFAGRWFQRMGKRRIATSVLTNVGKVFRETGIPETDDQIQCGNLMLTSVAMVPPVDDTTPLTFGCNIYAERLSVAVNYRREQFSETDAKGLLEDFVNRLKNSAAALTASC